ncbi:MAG: NAD(P)-binding domain-containing protein [Pseudomonadota bacterium]
MSAIGILGTGHIAAPIARHLALKGHSITVSQRNHEVATILSGEIGAEIKENQTVVDASEVVLICVRPQIAEEVLGSLRFRSSQRVISVMSGFALADLKRLCAPATKIELTIPLGFLEFGGCPLPGFPTADILADLFAPENPVIKMPSESALNDHLTVCAAIPGVLDILHTVSSWLSAKTGDADGAEFYTTQLISGFLASMQKHGVGSLADQRDAIATQGTYSLALKNALHHNRVHTGLEMALKEVGESLEVQA